MKSTDINGDPNKFVTLTSDENTAVNYDKVKWIKIFEDIIEKNDGKCYLTKEEMKKRELSAVMALAACN